MTIPNFEHLANTPGVTFKKFCTFCTNEAEGDIQYPMEDHDDEMISLPVCGECAQKLLDKTNKNVLD